MILENQFKTEDLHISLSRGPCLGTCPVFEVSLDGNGKVHYTGKSFVKETGIRTHTIDPDQAFKLLKYAVKIGFFDFKANYDTALTLKKTDGLITGSRYRSTDHPETRITITVGRKSKTVTEGLGAPLALLAFQKRIERIAGISDWI